jgi:kynureninase
MDLQDIQSSPNALARHYSRFRVAERMLLTGHSHQAWPDVGFDAQKRAWLDAAELVDAKWTRAFEKWERICRGYAALLGDTEGDITLSANTHDLVVRFLSALPLRERPRLVTTDAEFHTIRRQLDRLAEEGLVDVVKVPGYPAGDVAERVAEAVDDRTAAVLVSAVFFERGVIVRRLAQVAEACARHGAELLVDAYHALGVVPFDLTDHGLQQAFVVGGGYKYLQLGEGNCFLRTPPDCAMRPLVTGWFSEFEELSEGVRPDRVVYGRGSMRFAGATFDPTAHYRGAAVIDFFESQGLTPEFLRVVSRHQVGLLATTFRSLSLDARIVALDDTVGRADRAGFLALDAPDAVKLSRELLARGVHADARGRHLRFGPAPYLSDAQLVGAMEALGEVIRGR